MTSRTSSTGRSWRRLTAASETADKVIVLYCERCFVDLRKPLRVTDTLIEEQDVNATRVRAMNCVDMLATKEERDEISGGDKVYWLTPGWLRHWDFIFKDWDAGKANETFPQHDRAVVLDAIGYFDKLMTESPERILKISDWMKLPVEPAIISLERLKRLLAAMLNVTDH